MADWLSLWNLLLDCWNTLVYGWNRLVHAPHKWKYVYGFFALGFYLFRSQLYFTEPFFQFVHFLFGLSIYLFAVRVAIDLFIARPSKESLIFSLAFGLPFAILGRKEIILQDSFGYWSTFLDYASIVFGGFGMIYFACVEKTPSSDLPGKILQMFRRSKEVG